MYDIEYSTKFKKDYKRSIKRGKNPELLEKVITYLSENGTLPAKYKAHKLIGNYAGL